MSCGISRARVLFLNIAILLAGSSAALAQSKLDARYTASLGGVPIGRGAWIIDIADNQYTAAASGRVAGVLQAVTSGEGSAAARGTIASGRLLGSSYAMSSQSDRKTDEVRMALASGVVKEIAVEPEMPPSPDRIPIADGHKRNVIDPMTASIVVVGGSGDPVSAEACGRTLPVFDGRGRFDLTLSFKRLDRVKAEKGYQGPVVVCTVMYNPIAGHRPGRPAIKYLTETRDIEVWLAPITGTRVMVPFKVIVPTPMGSAVLSATQFIVSANATRPASLSTNGR